MVTRNRGHIQVSSVEGQGTIFSVDFPAFDMEDEQ
jgi:signal transduction histidine kinase